jgi:integrase
MWREAWRELVCFTAIARFSDVNRLRRKDIHVEGDTIRIVLNVRKNDPYHKTHTAFLVANSTRYCPVKITKMYLDLLPQDPESFMIPDLSFKEAHTKAANYGACRRLQKSLLEKLGLDSSPFGLHSARVGAMKYMENAEISDPDMAYIVGWAAGSIQPTHYAKTAMGKYLKAARKLTLF